MNAVTRNHLFDTDKTGKICSKHGVVTKIFMGREFCEECAREQLAQSQIDHAKALQKSIADKRLAAATLPDRYVECGFKNYAASIKPMKIAKDQCLEFAHKFLAGKTKNLIMTGRTGTGKTHLACAIARNILTKGGFARYITSEDMANNIASAWTRPDDSEASAIYRFTEYDLLIIDEYGLHDQHENRLRLVHKVLYSRYDSKKPTVLISNLTTKELRENLGDRLWSRFQHDGLIVVECNWADVRTGS